MSRCQRKFYYNIVERGKSLVAQVKDSLLGRTFDTKKARGEKEDKNGEWSVYSCLTAEWVDVWFPTTSFNPLLFIKNIT